MITVEQSWNFEFFREINQQWLGRLLEIEKSYIKGEYHRCGGDIRIFFESCIVKWIYDKKQLTLPDIKPKKLRVDLFDKIDHEPFKKWVPDKSIRKDMNDLLPITNPPSHSFEDTFTANPENADKALETIHRIVSWFYKEFHNGNPLEIPNFTLPQSQEKLRSEQLIVSKLQNTRTNGPALQKRHTTRQTDTETQDRIMAFLHAAAPIKKEEAIAVLSNKLNLPRIKENIHILITDNIIKQAGDTLLVHRAHAESKAICTDAYNQHLPQIISLLEQLP
jgi:hypothetical protein